MTFRQKSSGGFTLIELIAVIIIIGLMATVAVPSASSVFGLRAKKEARALVGFLQLTYNASVMQGRRLRVQFDFNEHRYWIEELSPMDILPPLTAETNLDDAILAFRKLAEMPMLTEDEKKQALDARFKEADVPHLKPKKLPAGVFISLIKIADQTYTGAERGTVALPFQPNGYSPEAWIQLKNKRGQTYLVHYPSIGGRPTLEKGTIDGSS